MKDLQAEIAVLRSLVRGQEQVLCGIVKLRDFWACHGIDAK
jgi:hypothetical protein